MWGKKYYYAGQKFLASTQLNFRHNTIMKTMMKWWSWIARKRSVYIQFFMILVSSGRRHDLLRVRYYMIILSALPPHLKQNNLVQCTAASLKSSVGKCKKVVQSSVQDPSSVCGWKQMASSSGGRAKIWFTSLTSRSGLSLSRFLPRPLKMWQFWQ